MHGNENNYDEQCKGGRERKQKEDGRGYKGGGEKTK